MRGVETVYNEYGFVSETRDARRVNGSPVSFYERTLEVDVRGNVTKYVLGNGVIVTKRYDEATGRLEKVTSVDPFTFVKIQDLTYDWDTVGNLSYRHDQSGDKDLEETFDYDGINRLESSTTHSNSGGPKKVQSIRYDLMGNITYKSDVGTYRYGEFGAGPHAMTTIEIETIEEDDEGSYSDIDEEQYFYDANGNNTRGEGRTLKYSTFDKVIDVSRDTHRTTFSYGPERSRYKRVDTDSSSGGTDKTTYYLGNVEFIQYTKGEREGETEYKRALGMALETLLYKDEKYVKEETHFLLQDHLGSTDVIVDSEGQVVQEMSFDAWGQRRDAIDWQALGITELVDFDTNITTRGYTGHEMVDGVGIIHMNGRIYDARLARFLQADPHIQAPYNTQSLNRYAYVWNNPLNSTDPTGYLVFTAAFFIKAFTAAVVSFAVTTVVAVIQGASLGEALGAGLKSAITTFAGIYLTAGFTELFNNAFIGEVLGQATAGGISSVLNGGEFGHGFVNSIKHQAVQGLIGSPGAAGNGPGGLLYDVIVGGTVSELTGGKFANGAQSAAISWAVRVASPKKKRNNFTPKTLGQDDFDRSGFEQVSVSTEVVLVGKEIGRNNQAPAPLELRDFPAEWLSPLFDVGPGTSHPEFALGVDVIEINKFNGNSGKGNFRNAELESAAVVTIGTVIALPFVAAQSVPVLVTVARASATKLGKQCITTILCATVTGQIAQGLGKNTLKGLKRGLATQQNVANANRQGQITRRLKTATTQTK